MGRWLVAEDGAFCALGGPGAWHGCYSGQHDLWTAESYSHPAKMGVNLAFRILQHLKELGLLQEGGVVLDPMCGTGTTLLAAAIRGHRAVGLELEKRFCEMARANAERIALKGFGAPIEVLQGDARHLSDLLQERGMVAVSSPPYGFNPLNLNASELDGPIGNRSREKEGRPPGDPLVAVTSLPYQDTLKDSKPLSERQDKTAQILRKERPNTYDKTGAGSAGKGYGSTPGQIGALPDKPVGIVSPPYGNQEAKGAGVAGPNSGAWKARHFTDKPWKDYSSTPEGYGSTPGQIANLPDGPIAVTSPPYEDSTVRNVEEAIGEGWRSKERGAHANPAGYGQVPGQIGRPSKQVGSENYLEAMAQVYAQLAKVCPVLVVVVKDPTRNGKLRLLGQDTAHLMEQVGYRLVCWHHAMLFEEQHTATLDGQPVKRVRGRLSFFKLLAYRRGSPVAQWEHVLIGLREGQGAVGVMSPPYANPRLAEGDTLTDDYEASRPNVRGKGSYRGRYGNSKGQVGNLRDR